MKVADCNRHNATIATSSATHSALPNMTMQSIDCKAKGLEMKPKNASNPKKHALRFNAESRHRLPDDCSLSYDAESGLFTIVIPLGLNSKECDVLSILSQVGGYKYSESGLAVNVSVAINKKRLSEWAEANGVDLGE